MIIINGMTNEKKGKRWQVKMKGRVLMNQFVAIEKNHLTAKEVRNEDKNEYENSVSISNMMI